MKQLITLALAIVLSMGSMTELRAQDDSFTPMWESFYITPDYTKLKELGEAMSKHNKKYHSEEGPHHAVVFNVVSGPNIGKMVWQMGPLKFSHLDSRPKGDGHDEDWRDNVMPNVKKLSSGEYWKQDMKASNTESLDGIENTPILHIRFHEVAKDHGYTVDHLLQLISGTIKAMDGDNPWGVYDNQFRQGYRIGRHLATVSFLKNYAEYDEPNTFKETFIKVYGEENWQPFVEGMTDSMSNSWDEIWEYNAELSGN